MSRDWPRGGHGLLGGNIFDRVGFNFLDGLPALPIWYVSTFNGRFKLLEMRYWSVPGNPRSVELCYQRPT